MFFPVLSSQSNNKNVSDTLEIILHVTSNLKHGALEMV